MKKINKFFKERARKAEARYNEVHKLSQAGFEVGQIKKVIKVTNKDNITPVTIRNYLKFDTYAKYSAYHKNNQKRSKDKKKAQKTVYEAQSAKIEVLEPVKEVRRVVKQQPTELNQENLNLIIDQVANVYEQLQNIKWNFKK